MALPSLTASPLLASSQTLVDDAPSVSSRHGWKLPGWLRRPAPAPTSPAEFRQLQLWNAVLCAVHAVQGVAMLVVGVVVARGAVPMETAFSAFDAGTASFVPGLQPRGTFQPGSLLCIIFLVSACAHGVQAAGARRRGWWQRQESKHGASQLRWFEYAISYGLMFYLVAMVVGMHEILLSLCFAGLVSVQMLMQLAIDNVRGDVPDRALTDVIALLPHFFASIPLMYVAIALYCYQYNPIFLNTAPFLTQVASMTALFFPFALQLVQQAYFARIIPSFDLNEKAIMALNAVAKTLVGWLLFAFFLQLAPTSA